MPASEKVTPLTKNPVAQRVAAYVNERYGGNLSRASRAIKCDYATLWATTRGVLSKPNVALLIRLAEHSGKSLDWWLTGVEP